MLQGVGMHGEGWFHSTLIRWVPILTIMQSLYSTRTVLFISVLDCSRTNNNPHFSLLLMAFPPLY